MDHPNVAHAVHHMIHVSRNNRPKNAHANDTRIERLLGAAFALCDVEESGGPNRGVMVERFLHAVHLAPGNPWCAAFVSYLGYRSQLDPVALQSSWPLPMTGSCVLLGDIAGKHGILLQTPERGDVFLLYDRQLARFAHTGIIADVVETAHAYTCVTIEGNTNDDGSPEGTKSCAKIRAFAKESGHRFIRWTAWGQPSASISTHAPRTAA